MASDNAALMKLVPALQLVEKRPVGLPQRLGQRRWRFTAWLRGTHNAKVQIALCRGGGGQLGGLSDFL